jgi:chromosome condensin MukBEF ATPase and DNA-binding subunit MukB
MMDTLKKKKGIPSTRAYKYTPTYTQEEYERRIKVLNENRVKAQQKHKEFYENYRKEKKMNELINLHKQVGSEVVHKEKLEEEKEVCNILIEDYEKEIEALQEEKEQLQEEKRELTETIEGLMEVIKEVGYWCKDALRRKWRDVFDGESDEFVGRS